MATTQHQSVSDAPLSDSRPLDGLRVVAVHAHPDDEALWTGGLLAHLSQRGAEVTVVTCTLGEQGEVIGDDLQLLTADNADQLGGYRIGELSRSKALLGVKGVFLGGAGRWRDSGMVDDPANEHPRAFIHSGDEAVQQLADILRTVQPHLVVTYGPDGGYGHPDHIQAHRITHAAAQELGITNIWWAVTLRSAITTADAALRRTPEVIPSGWRFPEEGEIAAVDSAEIVVPLDDAAYEAKAQAMAAHATQLLVEGEVFALSNFIAQPLLHEEFYQVPGSEEQGVDPQQVRFEDFL